MKYDKKICKILSDLIDVIPSEKARESKFLKLETFPALIERGMTQYYVEELLNVLSIEFVIFGDDGECGLAVFLDDDYKEVIRLAFEQSSKGTHSWITGKEE